jgi:hypothetical protein
MRQCQCQRRNEVPPVARLTKRKYIQLKPAIAPGDQPPQPPASTPCLWNSAHLQKLEDNRVSLF